MGYEFKTTRLEKGLLFSDYCISLKTEGYPGLINKVSYYLNSEYIYVEIPWKEYHKHKTALQNFISHNEDEIPKGNIAWVKKETSTLTSSLASDLKDKESPNGAPNENSTSKEHLVLKKEPLVNEEIKDAQLNKSIIQDSLMPSKDNTLYTSEECPLSSKSQGEANANDHLFYDLIDRLGALSLSGSNVNQQKNQYKRYGSSISHSHKEVAFYEWSSCDITKEYLKKYDFESKDFSDLKSRFKPTLSKPPSLKKISHTKISKWVCEFNYDILKTIPMNGIGLITQNPVNSNDLRKSKGNNDMDCKTFKILKKIESFKYLSEKIKNSFITDIFPQVLNEASKDFLGGGNWALIENQITTILLSKPKILILAGDIVRKGFEKYIRSHNIDQEDLTTLIGIPSFLIFNTLVLITTHPSVSNRQDFKKRSEYVFGLVLLFDQGNLEVKYDNYLKLCQAVEKIKTKYNSINQKESFVALSIQKRKEGPLDPKNDSLSPKDGLGFKTPTTLPPKNPPTPLQAPLRAKEPSPISNLPQATLGQFFPNLIPPPNSPDKMPQPCKIPNEPKLNDLSQNFPSPLGHNSCSQINYNPTHSSTQQSPNRLDSNFAYPSSPPNSPLKMNSQHQHQTPDAKHRHLFSKKPNHSSPKYVTVIDSPTGKKYHNPNRCRGNCQGRSPIPISKWPRKRVLLTEAIKYGCSHSKFDLE
ncbi:hypothetical protein CYY_005332 [Polysphondylium violaceum]|uniref:Uncharacterized protein n=1 Tax=Polysphondylium violaceum TaxID=133409 RepID=A0A8J4PUI9_9MYCE|nr:hypothetical protein CYY_005332 [Polysphondylium violaceum]